MLRAASIIALLVAGCSKGPQADLQYIKQARSAASEWALVNEQAGRGRLTDTYVASMHQWLRDEIRSSSATLTQPDTSYGLEIHALMQQPDDAAPEELRSHAEKLKQIEDGLESA
jgi:hypothetical protein